MLPVWAGVTLVGCVGQFMTGIRMRLDPHLRVPSRHLVTILQFYLEHAGSMSLLENVTFSQTKQVSNSLNMSMHVPVKKHNAIIIIILAMVFTELIKFIAVDQCLLCTLL